MMHFIDYGTFKKTTAFFTLQPCRAHFGFIILLFIVCAGVLVFSCFAPMDDIIKVSVVLRPQDAVSSVRCVQEGELSRKMYENGQYIREGELLFNLDTSAGTLALESARSKLVQLTGDIQVFKTLLRTMQTGRRPSASEETEEYSRSAAYLYEKEYYTAQIGDLAIKLERESSKPAALSILQNIQDIRSEYDKTVLQYNSWYSAQTVNAMEKYKTLQTEKNSMESRILELERSIKNATLYAPISGRITEVKKLNSGDYILPGEEIIRIVPEQASSLKAELYIDPAYIARVSVGDEIKIRFPGLPPSRYGQLVCFVSLIPPDCTMQETGIPLFVAEADIREPWLVSKRGERVELLPGITAEGRIITEKSTIMRMVLRKLDFMQ